MVPHVEVEAVLPLEGLAADGADEVLLLGVLDHVLGQVVLVRTSLSAL